MGTLPCSSSLACRKFSPQAATGGSTGRGWTPSSWQHPGSQHWTGTDAQRAALGQGGCRDSQRRLPAFSPLLPTPPPEPRAGQMGPWREEAEGGGQAGEEVISPQLAPLPRSLKGRRKPPGLPQWPCLLRGQASARIAPGRIRALGTQLPLSVHPPTPRTQDPG